MKRGEKKQAHSFQDGFGLYSNLKETETENMKKKV